MIIKATAIAGSLPGILTLVIWSSLRASPDTALWRPLPAASAIRPSIEPVVAASRSPRGITLARELPSRAVLLVIVRLHEREAHRPRRPRPTRSSGWVVFFLLGALLSVHAIYLMVLPSVEPDHWREFTTDPKMLAYLADDFRSAGAMQLGSAVMSMAVLAVGFDWLIRGLGPLLVLPGPLRLVDAHHLGRRSLPNGRRYSRGGARCHVPAVLPVPDTLRHRASTDSAIDRCETPRKCGKGAP